MEKNKKSKKKSDALCINSEYIKRKDITSFFFNSKYKPMTLKQIKGMLNIQGKEKYILDSILNDLCSKGKLMIDKSRRYVVIKDEDKYECIFECKNDRFGFGIIKDKSKKDDIYIPDTGMGNAMNGDEVLVVLDKSYSGKRQVGTIVDILKRKVTKIVGSVYKVGDKVFVESIDTRIPNIYIDKILVNNDIINSMVEVNITSYPSRKTNFIGDITKVICKKDEINAYVKSLYVFYDLDKEFNKEVLEEIKDINDEVNTKDLEGRVDKSKDNIYTIDSEDAKDLDDAISVKKNEDGSYVLSVHIADVSHYVKDNTKLDKEAVNRATSIYVPGSVIPMLPKKLSNGICSLTEGKLRLTLAVDMHIDNKGNVLNNEIYKSYIISKKKMTYEKVYKCITKSDEEVLKEYKSYIDDIDLMKELAHILNKKRQELGSINFDIPETKVKLNEDGSIKDIQAYETNISNKIIEEFMLITNMVVAKRFLHLSSPFIYRIHEKPDKEKLHNLNEILIGYGKKLKSIDNMKPKDLASVLDTFGSEEEKTVLSTITLRTLKLAKYSNECDGHFGLAFKYYCHFTSPIRRYPDLFIHRVISSYLENGHDVKGKVFNKYKNQSKIYSEISTDREKESTKIEREFNDLYSAMFMKDKIGEEFNAVISSVTSFGMFVKLKSTIEGLVHISNMKGYYHFDEKRFILVSDENIYRIGDKVKVKLINVDVKSKQIDFKLV